MPEEAFSPASKIGWAASAKLDIVFTPLTNTLILADETRMSECDIVLKRLIALITANKLRNVGI